MDKELQSLIKTIYGDRLINDRFLDNMIASWNSNINGYRDVMRKQAEKIVNKSNRSNKPNSPAFLSHTTSQVLPASSIQQIPTMHTTVTTTPSNDFSSIANFNEAFRQARKAGLKTFVWKKTKGNPSGLFSTELASKETETKKPELKSKEKNSGKSTPASKGQPLTKKDYAFDGSRINIEKMPYVDLLDENDPYSGNYPEFGSNAELYINPDEYSGLPYLYPGNTTINQVYQLKFPEPEIPEITGNTMSDQLREQLKEYMKYHNGVRYRYGYGRDSNFMEKGGIMNKINYFAQGGAAQNNQANAFMQAVLQGDSDAIGQLIQAAKQGDKNADKLIQTILQEDLKGNQQVAKAASVIKQLINSAVSAKWGSKLTYIKSLKFAKGGKTCATCMSQGGQSDENVKVAKKDVDTKTYQKQSLAKKLELDEHRLATETSSNKDGSYNISHKPSAQDSTEIKRSTMSPELIKKHAGKKACGGVAKKHYYGGDFYINDAKNPMRMSDGTRMVGVIHKQGFKNATNRGMSQTLYDSTGRPVIQKDRTSNGGEREIYYDRVRTPIKRTGLFSPGHVWTNDTVYISGTPEMFENAPNMSTPEKKNQAYRFALGMD